MIKLMPCLLKPRRGAIPLLIVFAIAAILTIGGAYAAKNNLLNSKKVLSTNTSQTSLTPSLVNTIGSSSTSTVPLAKGSITYKPDSANLNAPQFSITPPSGWVKVNGKEKVKLRFEAPKIDRKEIGNFHVESTANIQVTSEKSKAANLEAAFTNLKSLLNATSQADIEIISEEKTTLAGNDAYYLEAVISFPNLNYEEVEADLKSQNNTTDLKDFKDLKEDFKIRMVGYLIYSDGYEVGIGATSLASVWGERAGQIRSSISTFTLLNKQNKTASSQTSKNSATYPTPTPQPAPKFNLSTPKGWPVVSNHIEADYTSFEVDHIYDPNTQVRINIRRLLGSSSDQVISSYKESRPWGGNAPISVKNITLNGIPGVLAEYTEKGAFGDYYNRHYYEFEGYSGNFEINVQARTFERLWNQFGNDLKKAVDTFKLAQ